MKSHLACALAACGLCAPSASAIVTYEDSFDNGVPTLNNYLGLSAPNYATPLSESDGSLRFGAASPSTNWSNVNMNTPEVFQLPAIGQTTSVEWEIGPMTVTNVGVESYGDIRQQLSLVSANFDSKTFRADAYGFGGSTGAFIGR